MKMRRRTKHGFTLVELLVVIAIIGILIALLLPAIQAAREAARRTQCSQNLSQLIIAVHNYEMAHSLYPPGTIEPQGPIQNHAKGYHHNWIIQLLPYMEENVTYKHIDRSVGVYHPNNAAVRKLTLPVLNCPSQPASSAGYTGYAGVHHDVEAPIDTTNNGIFFLNSKIGYSDVTDGSAWTLFIGEKAIEQGDLGWMSGTRATLRNTSPAASWAARGVRPKYERDPLKVDEGYGYGYGSEYGEMGYGDEGMYGADEYGSGGGYEEAIEREPTSEGANEQVAESALAADGEDATEDPNAENQNKPGPILPVGGFDSPHPGGTMFACGDGRVTFISMTISPQVLQQLGHRADGKLLDKNDF